MTLNAGIKRVAALVLDGDDIALGMVVRALRICVDLDAANYGQSRDFFSGRRAGHCAGQGLEGWLRLR